jgi:hypothetical protein
VLVRSENDVERDNKVSEVQQYLYGRSFYLGSRDGDVRNTQRLFFVVETHYASAICDRLASGLFAARRLDESEVGEWVA